MSSKLTAKVSTDDDLDFLTKSSKSSRLSSLFSDPLNKDSMDTSSNSSLRYVPPKQPKPGSSDVATNRSAGSTRAAASGSSSSSPASANPVLVAIKVEAFELKDNAFKSVGAAVCCVLAGKPGLSPSHALLLYQNPKMPLARVVIDEAFTLTVQTSDCAFFRDVENRCWSMKAGTEQLLDLLRQVGVCRALSSSSGGGVVLVQPLSPSLSDASTILQPGDWAEVTPETLAVSTDGVLGLHLPPGPGCRRVRVCVPTTTAVPLQEGAPWWVTALLGAGRGERRLAVMLEHSKDSKEVKACELVVEKIKKRKKRCKSPSASSVPALAAGDSREDTTATEDTTTPEDTKSTDQKDGPVAHPAATTSSVVQDDPRARVLSRIARVGQSVFGAPPAASTDTPATADPTSNTPPPLVAAAGSGAVTPANVVEQSSISESELDWMSARFGLAIAPL